MRSWSRRLLLAASALSVAAVVPRPAGAQIPVTDVAGNFQWVQQTLTQLKQLAQQAQSYGTQLAQYQTQLQQYQNMLTNSVALPMQVWGTVQNDMMQVRNIASAGSVLTGNAGSMIGRLQSVGGYANQLANMPTNMGAQLGMWQTTIGNNLNTFGRTLGLQQTQSASDAALIAAIQRHSETAPGQLAAIQAGNELAAQTAQQLMQVRQTIAAAAQMQAGYYAVQTDRQATEDAALQQFLSAPQFAATGNPRY